MFKIGAFSKLVRVSPRMLRHYEKCGLLLPARVDPFTGYRLYSAEQIPLLSKIVSLRDMGFTIEEIAEALPHFAEPDYMHSILSKQAEKVQASIDSEQVRLERVHQMLRTLRKEQSNMQYEVVLKSLPAVKVLAHRRAIPAYDHEGVLWHELGSYMSKQGISCPDTEERGYSIYHDAEHKETDVDVEIAVPVESLGKSDGAFIYRELEAIPLAATLRFAGPYENYSAASAQLAGWLEENGYEMAGTMRGVSICSPQDTKDAANYVTELQIPVQKA